MLVLPLRPGAADAPPVAPAAEAVFPALAPLPDVPVPADNPITPAKVELGRLLFFDDRLSGDVSTSCASCHDPRLGWGDGNALSRGYPGTQHWRNSQTAVNSAYLAKLFWAGESTSLEAQANSAITGALAGNGDPVMIEERLAQIPRYVELFRAYLRKAPPR
jgi:cytochrome c peroxidase